MKSRQAYVLLKEGPHYRRDAVAAGLRTLGYHVQFGLPCSPTRDDVLVVWNRYGSSDVAARMFPGPVFVMENGYLGHDFLGDKWYSLSLTNHNGAGEWLPDGPERWDSFKVSLSAWNVNAGGPIVVLAQRGIGAPGLASPQGWERAARDRMAKSSRCRAGEIIIRPHPGKAQTREPLGRVLKGASVVWTWGSGAAVKALMYGYPVIYDCPTWIGRGASTFADHWLSGQPLRVSQRDRRQMFERLAWAMWRVDEIATGWPFRRLGA